MANTITVTAITANTTKTVEYLHPNTGVWQDSNVFNNVTAGTYNQIICRLKTSNPAIQYIWTTPVVVSGASNQLSAPTNGTAISLNATTIRITADTVTNATGYNLFRSTDISTGYTQVGGLLSTPTYDNIVTADVTYYYKWKAIGNGSSYIDSPLSNVVIGNAGSLIRYDKTGWTNLNDFTIVGNATLTLNNGDLLLATPPGSGSFEDYFQLPYTTLADSWSINMQIQIENAEQNSFGIGIGLKTANTYGGASIFTQTGTYLDNTNSPHWGSYTRLKSPGYLSSNYEVVAGLDVPELVPNGSILNIYIEYREGKVYSKINNPATGAYRDFSYDYVLPNQPYLPNTAKVTVNAFGGTYRIKAIKHTVIEKTGVDWMFIGDSKTQGYNSTFETRFVNQVREGLGAAFSVSNQGGGYDRTIEVVSRLSELQLLAPQNAVLNIGSNDKRSGETLSAWSTRYQNIVSTLQAVGTDVWHLLMFNEASLDFTDYNSFITSTYPSNRVIDAGTLALAGDGVHPNVASQAQIANAFFTKIGATPKVNYKLVLDGNSITYGLDGDFTGILQSQLNTALTNLQITDTISLVNYAVSGQTTPNMITDEATQIYPAYNSAVKKTIFFGWETFNHLRLDDTVTAAQAYDSIKLYFNNLKNNVEVNSIRISATPPPDMYNGSDPAFNPPRATTRLNDTATLMRSGIISGDLPIHALADIRADTAYNPSNSSYSSDGVHPNTTGYTNFIAPRVVAAILQALYKIKQPAAYV